MKRFINGNIANISISNRPFNLKKTQFIYMKNASFASSCSSYKMESLHDHRGFLDRPTFKQQNFQ